MDKKTILDIGSILSDFNQEAASKVSSFVQDKLTDQGGKEAQDSQAAEHEDREPIFDYEATYQEACQILENIKAKWGAEDTDHNLQDPYYQRDLLYLYDRINLDMDYLNEYPESNNEWLEKLLEVKFEIRNLL